MSSGWPMPPPQNEGPGAGAPGPRVNGSEHHCRQRVSTSHIRTGPEGQGCGDRVNETGEPPLVRWRLRCPRAARHMRATAGDPTVLGPLPFLDFLCLYCYVLTCYVLSTGYRAHDLLAAMPTDGLPTAEPGIWCWPPRLSWARAQHAPGVPLVLLRRTGTAGRAEREPCGARLAPSPAAGGSSASLLHLRV